MIARASVVRLRRGLLAPSGEVVGLLAALALAVGCASEIEAGGDGVDAGPGDDPLAVDNPAPAGSLEDLQRAIIAERCSGEPGLCHNGQFEPNLSTVGNTYAYLVRRPATENTAVARVAPGDPDASFLIDKLRNRNGVATQMPLGAEPLSEDEIQMFEDWIRDGARRAPSLDTAPVLNNPPNPPELGVFDGATRLDGPGTFTVPANTAITFRHSVDDFETADADIFIGGVVFSTPTGNLEAPAGGDFFQTSHDAANPPQGSGDLLNFSVDVTFGANVDVITATGVQSVPTAGLVITPIAIYADDDLTAGGIVTVRLPDNSFEVQ